MANHSSFLRPHCIAILGDCTPCRSDFRHRPAVPLRAPETAITLGHLQRDWYGSPMSNLTALSAIELSQTIAAGDASCVEVMDAFLNKIEALNRDVNALVNLIPRDECLNLARKPTPPLALMQDLNGCTEFR